MWPKTETNRPLMVEGATFSSRRSTARSWCVWVSLIRPVFIVLRILRHLLVHDRMPKQASIQTHNILNLNQKTHILSGSGSAQVPLALAGPHGFEGLARLDVDDRFMVRTFPPGRCIGAAPVVSPLGPRSAR